MYIQASWYRERQGGGRISPSRKILPHSSPFTHPHHPAFPHPLPTFAHPDLIPPSRSVDDFDEDIEVQTVDQNTAQRLHVLQMQLALGKHFSSLDVNNISIGLNKLAQTKPNQFCVASQTDDILYVDSSSNTILNSETKAVQCVSMVNFAMIQTDELSISDSDTQTGREYIVETETQTEEMLYKDNFTLMKKPLPIDNSMQIETNDLNPRDCSSGSDASNTQSTMTEASYILSDMLSTRLSVENAKVLSTDGILTEITTESLSLQTSKRENSQSPPLTPPAPTESVPQGFPYPFMSVFNAMAGRLPYLGIDGLLFHWLCLSAQLTVDDHLAMCVNVVFIKHVHTVIIKKKHLICVYLS